MRTEQILYLLEIDKTSSLHKASENLHISPQALSLSIRNLENEFQFQILNRSRTGVTLTQKGNQLLSIGNQFLEQLKALQQIPEKEYKHILKGSLEIMATNGVMETFLPAAISQLYLDYPKFHLSSQTMEFEQIIQAMPNAKTEIALIYQLTINGVSLTNLQNTNLFFESFLSGTYYCMVHKNSPIYHYKSISVKSIAKYPFIIYGPTKALVLKLINCDETAPNIISVDNFVLYKQLSKDGAGLAMTMILDQSDKPAVPVPNMKPIPIKENIRSTLGYIRKTNHSLSPKASAFIQYLSDFYARPYKENLFLDDSI